MILRHFFVSRTGVLQPPWRIGAFVVISILSLIASSALVGPLVSSLFASIGARGAANESWVALAGFLAATAVCVRMIDKRPWSEVWLDRDAARPSTLGKGFLVGAACIGVPTTMLVVAGWLKSEPGSAGSWWVATARMSLVIVPAALVEELLTRGYILSVLREWWGWGWAIFATSAGFGLLHLRNPGATWASLSLVTLAGVFLAAVLYATRSLYAAWMAHLAWNWVMAAIFHAAVSGFPFESPGYRYVDAGPDWATGGEWGPEGGVPAALGMVAGTAFLLGRSRARSRGASANHTEHTKGERIDG